MMAPNWAYRLVIICARCLVAGILLGLLSALLLVATESTVLLVPLFVAVGILAISFFAGLIAWYPANRWALRYLSGARSGRDLGRRVVSMQTMLFKDAFTFGKR